MVEYQIKNILVATDFTQLSENALQTAVAIAERHSAELTLLNSIEYANFMLPVEGTMATDQMITELSALNEDNLKAMAAEISQKKKLKITTHLAIGNPADEICRAAMKLKSDLIVMGTHGASGIREFFLGSNAFNVVRKTPCPVLTIPGGAARPYFKTILFPIREIEGVLDKYGFIRKIIRKNNSTLRIIGLTNDGPERNIKYLADSVSKLQLLLQEDDVISTNGYFIGDNIAGEVLKEAEKVNADLIVITAELDFKIREFFVGPFAQQIVNHSTRPVLTIRPELTAEAVGKLEMDAAHDAKTKLWPFK